ncbi:MAG: ATP-binding protein, partial [Gammaproteobacteria bacterium]|nr:ATP-binding protein [Gammaproteobacteria bacterium]
MSEPRYVMRMSLNVLNHMGLYLYSNTPAVVAEVIANAWDADATEVDVDLDPAAMTITVRDNGVGMDLDDINEKFLYVGYRKRDDGRLSTTPRGRKPMGRKGIGKLSLFAIANRTAVYTRKAAGQPESLLLDARRIKEAIAAEDPTTPKEYAPENIPFDQPIPDHGT